MDADKVCNSNLPPLHKLMEKNPSGIYCRCFLISCGELIACTGGPQNADGLARVGNPKAAPQQHLCCLALVDHLYDIFQDSLQFHSFLGAKGQVCTIMPCFASLALSSNMSSFRLYGDGGDRAAEVLPLERGGEGPRQRQVQRVVRQRAACLALQLQLHCVGVLLPFLAIQQLLTLPPLVLDHPLRPGNRQSTGVPPRALWCLA